MNAFGPAHLELFRAALGLIAGSPAPGDTSNVVAPVAATTPVAVEAPAAANATRPAIAGRQPAAVFFGKLPWAAPADPTRVGEATIDALRATVVQPLPASSSRAARAADAAPAAAVAQAPTRGGSSSRRAAGFFGGLPWTGGDAGEGERTIITVEPTAAKADDTQSANLVAIATAQALQSARAAGVDEAAPDRTSTFFSRMPWGGRANSS